MCQSNFLLSNMSKQLFSKTFSRLFFAIFLVGSLFSLLGFNGIGNVEVQAAVETLPPGQSYTETSDCTSAEALAGNCIRNGWKYGNCTAAARGQFRCTSRETAVAGTVSNTQLDGGNGWKCDVSTDGNISKCTTNGTAAGNTAAAANCVSYKDKQYGTAKLSCIQDTLYFGVNTSDQKTISYWKSDDKGFIFKNVDGSSHYVPYSLMSEVCGDSPTKCSGDMNKGFPITYEINNFEQFKTKLVKLDPSSKNIVGSNEDISPDAFKSGTDKTKCNFATFDEIKTWAKPIPAGEKLLSCTGELILEKADGTLEKVDGTKLDSTGAIITGETRGREVSVTESLTSKVTKPISEGLGALFNIILTVISFIILALTYFAGWLAIGALWILGYLFLIFLRINPAGANFISVAVDPWRIVVGIANMFVLSTFIFVGFGYILDIAKLKVKIEDFLLKIIVFTLILNFTLLGSASIVNVTQGIGEIMVGAYSIGETDPQKANFALINGLIEGMSRASVLRCGNLEWALDGNDKTSPKPAAPALKPGETAPPSASESATGKDCDFGVTGAPGGVAKLFGTLTIGTAASLVGAPLWVNGKAGSIVSITIMEFVFLAIACFAVVQFWKALALVLGRTIGLWLLIVASPLALAAFISPIEGLKKYATQWLDHFWKWCLFYPCFIFCLILINIMSRSFADAANVQVNNLANNTNGIVTNAAFTIGVVDAVNLMLFAILGVVPMFLLSTTVDYFAKSFEAIAKMTLGAAKNAWTGFKGAAGAVGGAINSGATAVGNLSDKKDFSFLGLKGGVTKRRDAANKASSLQKDIDTQDGIINGTSGSYNATQVIAAEKEKEKLTARMQKAEAQSKARFTNGLDKVAKGGELFAALPVIAETLVEDAKYQVWDKNANNVKANQAAAKTRTKLAIEYNRRKNAIGKEIEELDAANPNSPMAGLGASDIARMEEKDPNHYKKLIKSSTDQARQNSLGLDKIGIKDLKSARLGAQDLIDIYGNDYAKLVADGKQYEFQRYIKASKSDSVLNNILFNSEFGTDLVREARGDLERSANGSEFITWLNETQPKTLEDKEARYRQGREIGMEFTKNPTSYKFPDGLDDKDGDIMRGIEETMDKDAFKKRFGDKIYTTTKLESTGQKVQYKARNGVAGYNDLKINTKEEEADLAAVRMVVAKSGFRGDVANAIIEDTTGRSADEIEKELRKKEYATGEMGEDEASIERGIAEIVSKNATTLLTESKLARRIKSKSSKVKSLLESGDADKEAEGLKLLKLGVIEAFSNAGDTYFKTKKELGEDFKKGRNSGNKVAAPHTYASSQLGEVVTTIDPATGLRTARSLEEIKAIIQEDENGQISNALGLAMVADIINIAKNKRQRMIPDIGIDTNAFVNIEPGDAARIQESLNFAITKTVQNGINPDGSFVDDSPLRDFETKEAEPGNSRITVDRVMLSTKIRNDGQKYLRNLQNSAEEGNLTTALESAQNNMEQAGNSSLLNTMSELNKENGDFVTNSDMRAKPVVTANPVNVPVVAPTPPPPVDPVEQRRNDIVNFNRAAIASGSPARVNSDTGELYHERTGAPVDRNGNPSPVDIVLFPRV